MYVFVGVSCVTTLLDMFLFLAKVAFNFSVRPSRSIALLDDCMTFHRWISWKPTRRQRRMCFELKSNYEPTLHKLCHLLCTQQLKNDDDFNILRLVHVYERNLFVWYRHHFSSGTYYVLNLYLTSQTRSTTQSPSLENL